jgi:hypothetical protein
MSGRRRWSRSTGSSILVAGHRRQADRREAYSRATRPARAGGINKS